MVGHKVDMQDVDLQGQISHEAQCPWTRTRLKEQRLQSHHPLIDSRLLRYNPFPITHLLGKPKLGIPVDYMAE